MIDYDHIPSPPPSSPRNPADVVPSCVRKAFAELHEAIAFWRGYARGLEAEREALRSAIRELVRLKSLKDEGSPAAIAEHNRPRAGAWQAALEALAGSEAEGPATRPCCVAPGHHTAARPIGPGEGLVVINNTPKPGWVAFVSGGGEAQAIRAAESYRLADGRDAAAEAAREAERQRDEARAEADRLRAAVEHARSYFRAHEGAYRISLTSGHRDRADGYACHAAAMEAALGIAEGSTDGE